jgi:hypothetical protein
VESSTWTESDKPPALVVQVQDLVLYPQVVFVRSRSELNHDYAIFFEGGLVEKMPNVSMSLSCHRKTFKFDVLIQAKGLVPVAIASEWIYTILGEKIEVGRLTHEYTAVKIAKKKSKKKPGKQRSNGNVELAVTGSKETVRTIRPGDLPGNRPDSLSSG